MGRPQLFRGLDVELVPFLNTWREFRESFSQAGQVLA